MEVELNDSRIRVQRKKKQKREDFKKEKKIRTD